MKLSSGFSIVILAWSLVLLPSRAIATDNGEQLRRTMAEIALLNSQMAQRKADAAGIRQALAKRLDAYKAEAYTKIRREGIQTQSAALKNPRMRYDLLLMAELQAYIDRYTRKISYYRVACDRLSYLYQQADDDLKIVSTLSGMKIDALVSQAEKILDEYLPDAQTLVIQPDRIVIDPPENIWKRLQAGR